MIIFLTEIDDVGFLYEQTSIKVGLEYSCFLTSESDDKDLVGSAVERQRCLEIRTGATSFESNSFLRSLRAIKLTAESTSLQSNPSSISAPSMIVQPRCGVKSLVLSNMRLITQSCSPSRERHLSRTVPSELHGISV